jgi:hypothetical protein
MPARPLQRAEIVADMVILVQVVGYEKTFYSSGWTDDERTRSRSLNGGSRRKFRGSLPELIERLLADEERLGTNGPA